MASLKLELALPEATLGQVGADIVLITGGDLRESANRACWPVQKDYEGRLTAMLSSMGYQLVRAHDEDPERGHGFIGTQREGSDVMSRVAPDARLIVLITCWQYAHHLAPSLAQHRGPILLLANFDGTWPGLVGTLCMGGTLTSLGRRHSRLWSESFDDSFFRDGLHEWLETGHIQHDVRYLKEVSPGDPLLATDAAAMGRRVGHYILRHKEIIGLFDSFCMGMMNGVFPQKALVDAGMPLESLSQSALVHEMAQVPRALREECLSWYESAGMTFHYGADPATELTREQVLEQCAMLIALARFKRRFGLTSVGTQYQQGLKDICAASDFAEGALGSTLRFPIPDEHHEVIDPGKPIPCINEVDMGTAVPQTMLFRLLDSLGLPAETTLHDIRWGSEYGGTFYWDMEISGAVPFEHLKNGIHGAEGNRQPPMYFPLGGSTLAGQGKAGTFLWARAHYEGTQIHLHVGTGTAYELPKEEFRRRRAATTPQWPLMNCVLDGVDRDALMAGHQSNHITIAYVEEDALDTVVNALIAQGITQNMRVFAAGPRAQRAA